MNYASLFNDMKMMKRAATCKIIYFIVSKKVEYQRETLSYKPADVVGKLHHSIHESRQPSCIFKLYPAAVNDGKLEVAIKTKIFPSRNARLQ